MTGIMKTAAQDGLEPVHPETFTPFTLRKHSRPCSISRQTVVSDKHRAQTKPRTEGECGRQAVPLALFRGAEIML